MNKLILLTCFIAAAVARPSVLHTPELRTVAVHSEIPVVKTKLIHEPTTVAVQEHTIEKVGEHVETIPTAVSHQSQTIVHSKADKITPIVAPAVRTVYTPTVRTYEKQYIEKIPIVESYAAPAPTLLRSLYRTPTYLKTLDSPTILRQFVGHGALERREIPLFFEPREPTKVIKTEELNSDDSVVINAEALPHGFTEHTSGFPLTGLVEINKPLIREEEFPKVIEGTQW